MYEDNNPDNKEERTLTDIIRKTNKVFTRTDSRALRYSGLGVQLAVVILVFLFAGIWLDKFFETTFVFTLILTMVGFAAGFYGFYLTITRLSSEDKKNKKS